MSIEPQHLYTAAEVANFLGVKRAWIHNRLLDRRDAPVPEFSAVVAGRAPLLLWSADGVKRWQAFAASIDSVPLAARRRGSYSDHKAVNRVGRLTSTWKLWWRCAANGGTLWWFSTPDGWYTSGNDGRTWDKTESMERPPDYHYYCVNGSVIPAPTTAAVLRSATELRRRIEKEAA